MMREKKTWIEKQMHTTDSVVEDNMVLQPEKMTRALFPHQLRAVKMMEDLESRRSVSSSSYFIETKIGIYSDLIGYGKTYTIVALILRDKMDWYATGEGGYINEMISGVFGNGVLVKKTLLEYKRISATLVVCNPSIIRQWKEEIDRTPLRCTVVHKMRWLQELNVHEYDVVLCLPSFYNSLLDRFSSYAWKRFVYDEPTHAKIKSMRSPVSQFTWFISSTPYDLMHKSPPSNHFMYSIFSHFMDLSTLKNIIIKNPDEYVRQSFVMPPIEHKYYECYQPMLFLVRDLITTGIAEMISAGNIEKAIRHLGGDSTSNVYDLVYNDKNEELREALSKIQKYERLGDEERGAKWKSKKATLERQIRDLRVRLSDILRNPCHICLCSLHQPVLITCCQNIFCGHCFLSWMKNKKTCPICRGSVSSDQLTYVQTLSDPDATTTTTTTTTTTPLAPDMVATTKRRKNKQQVLLEVLESRADGKFIIFSNYDETFQNIRDMMHEEKISFSEIRGSMDTREKQLQDFKTGTKTVLFLNSLTNGAGIGIQEATDVILYHKMNEDLQQQVIGRAYRIGRTQSLVVHHLL
jgi:SNF2 family DNA or RNA helicase